MELGCWLVTSARRCLGVLDDIILLVLLLLALSAVLPPYGMEVLRCAHAL